MSNNSNPSSKLRQEWINAIRKDAANAEKNGKPTKAQLDLIYEQQWLKALVPATYGGQQMSLPDVLLLEESLAYADGSIGWLVTLCAGAGWFGGFMDAAAAKKIFGDAKVCLAGSGASTGTAEKTTGGYIVNGKWGHASGAADATIFTANCVVMKKDKPVKDDAGHDKIITVALLKSEVKVTENWNAMGMVATASHDYETHNVTVPEDRTFTIAGQAAKADAPLYQFPFQQLAESTLAVNMAGMAAHFMDMCLDIMAERKTKDGVLLTDDHAVQQLLKSLQQKYTGAREKLYYAVNLAWQACAALHEIRPTVLYKVTMAADNMVQASRQLVNELYPYCGVAAADKDSDINRAWRDFHTAGQHNLLVAVGGL